MLLGETEVLQLNKHQRRLPATNKWMVLWRDENHGNFVNITRASTDRCDSLLDFTPIFPVRFLKILGGRRVGKRYV